MALSTIALCAGYGGLEIGLSAACGHVGWEHFVAAYVEREAYAAALLACRMEAGELDAAPVWSDLTTFDAASWRGCVDCITAGFPCQPHSHAGSRKGIEDERWIWPDIVRIIRESGAWIVVLENVSGLLSSGGFGPVLRDLAEMGFDAEWAVLPASAVGASHRRDRVFIVAHSRLQQQHIQQWDGWAEHSRGRGELADSLRIQRGQWAGRKRVFDGDTAMANTDGAEGRWNDARRGSASGSVVAGASETVDDPSGARRDGAGIGTGADIEGGQRVSGDGCEAMADPSDARLQGRLLGRGDHATGRQEQDGPAALCGLPLFAPGPSDERWPTILAQCPAIAPATESGVRLLADGATALVDEHRAHQLRCGGNGVVPLQAGVAIVGLMRRLGIT